MMSSNRTAAGCIELAGVAVLAVCVAAAGTAFMACIGSLYGLAWMMLACVSYVLRYRTDLAQRQPTGRLVRAISWATLAAGLGLVASLALSPHEFAGGLRRHGSAGPLVPAFAGILWWSLAINQCVFGGLLAGLHMLLVRSVARMIGRHELSERMGIAAGMMIAGLAFVAGLVGVLWLAGESHVASLGGPLRLVAHMCTAGTVWLAVAGAVHVVAAFRLAAALRRLPVDAERRTAESAEDAEKE